MLTLFQIMIHYHLSLMASYSLEQPSFLDVHFLCLIVGIYPFHMTLLEVSGLEKAYQNKKIITPVLRGVHFKIDQGEFVSIVGPSGSGKTTLLYVLGGLENYQKGVVKIFDKELSSYSESEKSELRARKIGFVFQFYNLIPNLNVLDNVMLASVVGKQKSKSDIIRLLEKVGMSTLIDRYPSQLSGGQQQRVAIARSLINDPDIIFADEPTGNLDEKTSHEIMALFSKLHKELNTTIVMVTHNEALIKYGSRMLSMHDGKVIKDEKLD